MVIRIHVGYCEWTFARLAVGMVGCDEVLMWNCGMRANGCSLKSTEIGVGLLNNEDKNAGDC